MSYSLDYYKIPIIIGVIAFLLVILAAITLAVGYRQGDSEITSFGWFIAILSIITIIFAIALFINHRLSEQDPFQQWLAGLPLDQQQEIERRMEQSYGQAWKKLQANQDI